MRKLSLIFIFLGSLCFWTCNEEEPGRLIFSPSSLHFTSESSDQIIELITTNSKNVSWEVLEKPSWLEIFPSSGILKTNPEYLSIFLVPNEVLNGNYSAIIKIFSSTHGMIEIPVIYEATKSTAINVDPSQIVFDYFVNTAEFEIENLSNSDASWEIISSTNIISLEPAIGVLSGKQSIKVVANIDRTNLSTGTYSEVLEIRISDEKYAEVEVLINHYNEEKWMLNGQIVDAEFDRVNNVIIALTDMKLLKLDPETRVAESLQLPLPASCISIGLEGQYAVAGHNGWVSLINLETMIVEKTYATSTDALDIILAPNFWAYVFPRRDQWENIRCTDLTNGTEVLHTGRQIYAGTIAKLHPGGNYIYGTNNGLSPNDAEKYEITGGQANYLYDSPYHGDFNFGGNLWITDDGSRMFTKSGNVFRLSTSQGIDLTYGGSISGEGFVATLDYSSQNKRVYAIFSDILTGHSKSEVRVYTSDFLSYVGSKPLSEFLVNTAAGYKLFNSEGQYGFFNSSGTAFHVLVKAPDVGGIFNNWAVVSIPVD